MPPLDFGRVAMAIAGCILTLPQMKSHAICWILVIIVGLGAATMHVYQIFERTRDLNSKALPAIVSVLALSVPAFLPIQVNSSSHFSSMFFWLSGKVKLSVAGGW